MRWENHTRCGIRHAENYRSEEITFQVAPFSSGYHALLGREAFTIFQAIPHYGYMKLKMPGPNGIITLASERGHLECDFFGPIIL